MLPIAHHWQRIGARIDGVYSGYLASPEQAQLLAQTLDCIAAPDTLVVIDRSWLTTAAIAPRSTTACAQPSRRLLSRADVITPNVTEAALLAGLPYEPGTQRCLSCAAVFRRSARSGRGRHGYRRAPAAGCDRQRRLRLPHGRCTRACARRIPACFTARAMCSLPPRGAARARRTAECRARNGHRAHGRASAVRSGAIRRAASAWTLKGALPAYIRPRGKDI